MSNIGIYYPDTWPARWEEAQRQLADREDELARMTERAEIAEAMAVMPRTTDWIGNMLALIVGAALGALAMAAGVGLMIGECG